jgi:hypothetical protein
MANKLVGHLWTYDVGGQVRRIADVPRCFLGGQASRPPPLHRPSAKQKNAVCCANDVPVVDSFQRHAVLSVRGTHLRNCFAKGTSDECEVLAVFRYLTHDCCARCVWWQSVLAEIVAAEGYRRVPFQKPRVRCRIEVEDGRFCSRTLGLADDHLEVEITEGARPTIKAGVHHVIEVKQCVPGVLVSGSRRVMNRAIDIDRAGRHIRTASVVEF